MRGRRGISAVATAVVFAIAITVLILVILLGAELYKAWADRATWEASIAGYKPPQPVNTTGGPYLDGYCLVNTVNGTTYISCP